ncbi:MAG TPA: 50S ribosomal protein L19e [Thermoplasmata archaeon]|nr:50S ribosomal protein L19e [Thermoplasmata archaeon]
MDLRVQRRMAADILKCGVNRVWMDPDRVDDISEAVTRGDIRILIKMGAIGKLQERGISRGRTRHTRAQKRKGRQRGPGSRRGRKYARTPKKRAWIQTIRPIRRELRRLRKEGLIDSKTYRLYYRHAKGGLYRNRRHMLSHMEAEDVLRKGGV